MPTYEDVFFLKLLWQEGTVNCRELDEALQNYYVQGCQGRAVSLVQVLAQLRVIPPGELSRLWNQALAQISQSQPESMALPPQILARMCQKQRLLGKSSLGSTFRVYHPQLGTCALKCLEGVFAQNKKFSQRFLSQTEKAKRAVHQGLAKIYAVDYPQNTIVREMIIGRNLEDCLDRGPLPLEQACWIVRQISEALGAAAKDGILVKNLKPTNVILSSDQQVKLVDFCLPPTIPHYLSPEQCAKKKSDFRSDMYSLGVLFYRMLTGVLPFDGTNSREIMRQHIESPMPRLPNSAGIPEALAEILKRLLAKNPDDRYSDFEEASETLRLFVQAEFERGDENQCPALEGLIEEEEIAPKETGEGEECECEGEEKEMHTVEMAVIAPSEEVVRHRKARRLAFQLVEEMASQYAPQIEEACCEGKFYSVLRNIIESTREEYQKELGCETGEESVYLDEALEELHQRMLREVKSQEDEDGESPKEEEEEEKEEEEALASEEKSESEEEEGYEAEEIEPKAQNRPGSLFPSISSRTEGAGEPMQEERREPAREQSIKFMFRSIPSTEQQLQQSTRAQEPKETEERAEGKPQFLFRHVPPIHEQFEEAPSKTQAPPEEAESEDAGLDDDDSMEAIAVCEEHGDDWEGEIDKDEAWEKQFEDVEEDHGEEDVTIDLPAPTDISGQKLVRALDIPISTKPIPQMEPGKMEPAKDQEEEWGPGRKGEEPVPRDESTDKPKIKLVPYFKFGQNSKE